MLVLNIESDSTFENFLKFRYKKTYGTITSLQGNIWNDSFRKSRVLPDKLVAVVTADNLKNQK